MKALKRILIILCIIMLPYLEIISRKNPILDAILPIIIIVLLIIGIVKLIKSIKVKIKKDRELKKEKIDILNQENEESVNLN